MFNRPIFIVSAPRSGSTMLFNLLKQAPNVWTIGGESHSIYNKFPHLRAENKEYDSGSLYESHADDATCKKIRDMYLSRVVDRDSIHYSSSIINPTLLEKTPRNSFNIKFILKVFPEARFVFLHRDAKQNISSIAEAWKRGQVTGQFVTYPKLPDFNRRWCLVLPPNWREYKNKSIFEIAAFQWKSCNDTIMCELAELNDDRWISLSYQSLITDPAKQVSNICNFFNIEYDEKLKKATTGVIPLSQTTITPPSSEKWRKYESNIIPLLPMLQTTIEGISKL